MIFYSEFCVIRIEINASRKNEEVIKYFVQYALLVLGGKLSVYSTIQILNTILYLHHIPMSFVMIVLHYCFA